jgi:hypothetical protein
MRIGKADAHLGARRQGHVESDQGPTHRVRGTTEAGAQIVMSDRFNDFNYWSETISIRSR